MPAGGGQPHHLEGAEAHDPEVGAYGACAVGDPVVGTVPATNSEHRGGESDVAAEARDGERKERAHPGDMSLLTFVCLLIAMTCVALTSTPPALGSTTSTYTATSAGGVARAAATALSDVDFKEVLTNATTSCRLLGFVQEPYLITLGKTLCIGWVMQSMTGGTRMEERHPWFFNVPLSFFVGFQCFAGWHTLWAVYHSAELSTWEQKAWASHAFPGALSLYVAALKLLVLDRVKLTFADEIYPGMQDEGCARQMPAKKSAKKEKKSAKKSAKKMP
eukprot:gene13226-10228_t